ncbi:hypothetical protein M431DRAFT_541660 [Trichoderma harzianum CBS 226.95]|uniref:Uncharacterized protein n=1 Tax=Trichoderma harzianum CBS 226.95 TaxID=983964 RepID=A0A2T3ZZ03_TRIHA|nr:hypothetical protein M431DRAFT_541660 [Trichoderma harzianum CBS 226.95]PTB50045.1 hypothetical protein M431DRAFT_541660 [Trichoderma harzianum CBS 226.95]
MMDPVNRFHYEHIVDTSTVNTVHRYSKRRATQHSAVQCGIEAAVRSPPTWHGPPRPPSNHHAVPGPAPSPLRCVALALSRCHTCTLTSTLTNVPPGTYLVLRTTTTTCTTAAARKTTQCTPSVQPRTPPAALGPVRRPGQDQ